MKKQMKRMLALVMVLALALGLAACGGQAASSAASSEATPASSEATPASSEATPASSEEAAPASSEEAAPGEKAVVPGELPLVPEGETVTLTIGIQQNPLTEDYETNDYTKWIEEQTGVNLDFVYFSSDANEAAQQLALMISGGEKLPDILYRNFGLGLNSTTKIFEYGEDGYLIDLKPYFDQGLAYYFDASCDLVSQFNPSLPETIMAVGTDPVTGGFYAWPWAEQGNSSDNYAFYSWINKKWLDTLGEEMPRTVEDLHNILLKFRDEDPNGNGQADEIPFIANIGGYRADMISFVINAFVYCNDFYFFNATDGQIWEPYTTDEYRQALIYLNQLYSEGLISPLTFTMAEDRELIPIFTPSDGTAIAGCVGGHSYLCAEMDNFVLFEYEPLAPLEDASGNGSGGYSIGMAPNLNYATAITCDCEDPELAFRVLDFMASEESMLRSRYGVLGRDWDWAAEGATNSRGREARVTVNDSGVYSTQNNACWHMVSAGIMNFWYWSSSFVDDGSYGKERTKQANLVIDAYDSMPTPDEVVYYLAYNAEEQAVVNEYKDILVEYIKTARAQFISGVLDPNSDAAWQEYLAACEAQGIKEYTEAAQSCYTRMFG